MLELSTPIKFVKRVGERVAVELAKRGVETVEDLLYHLPFRYEDRLNPVPMSALQAGTMASVIGEVRGSVLLQTRHMPLFEMTVGQGLNTVKCDVVSRERICGTSFMWGRWWRCTESWSLRGRARGSSR